MPQIDQIAATYASQIFWLLLTFGITFFVIGLGMFPKIQGTVDARDKRISDDLEAARNANAAADELEEDYRKRMIDERAEAQGVVAKAKDAAAKDAETRRNAADAEIAEQVAAAEASIKSKADAALKEIEDVAAEAAQDLVAKLSGAKATKAAALKQVKTVLHNG